MGNEEWIKAMEIKQEKQRNGKPGSKPPPLQPNVAEEFARMIANEYGLSWIFF